MSDPNLSLPPDPAVSNLLAEAHDEALIASEDLYEARRDRAQEAFSSGRTHLEKAAADFRAEAW